MYAVAKPYADPGMQRKLEWVACMLDASEASAAKIGCSPEAIVAQAAQETGWGRSAIGNNVFGGDRNAVLGQQRFGIALGQRRVRAGYVRVRFSGRHATLTVPVAGTWVVVIASGGCGRHVVGEHTLGDQPSAGGTDGFAEHHAAAPFGHPALGDDVFVLDDADVLHVQIDRGIPVVRSEHRPDSRHQHGVHQRGDRAAVHDAARMQQFGLEGHPHTAIVDPGLLDGQSEQHRIEDGLGFPELGPPCGGVVGKWFVLLCSTHGQIMAA